MDRTRIRGKGPDGGNAGGEHSRDENPGGENPGSENPGGESSPYDIERTRLSGAAGDAPPASTVLVGAQAGAHARPAPAARVDTSPAGAPIDVGSVVRGRFVLEERVGRGGMGIVWKARDRRREQAGDRNPHVALKVLTSEVAAIPEGFIALQREARKGQDLAHPNVVTIYDFDLDDATGQAYVIMELLQGQPLDELIRSRAGRAMPRAEAVPIIDGMSRGLAHAHRKGIVHADFKPGNVFVCRDGTPKILDFGIARAVRMAESERGDVTLFDAATLGALTPGYASPEMFSGEDPHPADDVYALGATAYQLLTGRHPFGGSSAPEAKAKGARPVPIAGLRRREWRAIRQALAFERSERHADAEAFRRAMKGPAAMQQALLGTVALLTIAGVGLGWYALAERDPVPNVAFNELSVDVRQRFAQELAAADRAWQVFVESNDPFVLPLSIEHYRRALEFHNHNPDAVAGLRRAVAQLVREVEEIESDPRVRLAVLEEQAEHPDLVRFRPLQEALERQRRLLP